MAQTLDELKKRFNSIILELLKTHKNIHFHNVTIDEREKIGCLVGRAQTIALFIIEEYRDSSIEKELMFLIDEFINIQSDNNSLNLLKFDAYRLYKRLENEYNRYSELLVDVQRAPTDLKMRKLKHFNIQKKIEEISEIRKGLNIKRHNIFKSPSKTLKYADNLRKIDIYIDKITIIINEYVKLLPPSNNIQINAFNIGTGNVRPTKKIIPPMIQNNTNAKNTKAKNTKAKNTKVKINAPTKEPTKGAVNALTKGPTKVAVNALTKGPTKGAVNAPTKETTKRQNKAQTKKIQEALNSIDNSNPNIQKVLHKLDKINKISRKTLIEYLKKKPDITTIIKKYEEYNIYYTKIITSPELLSFVNTPFYNEHIIPMMEEIKHTLDNIKGLLSNT